MKNRCGWETKDDLYIKYHDQEWGVPLRDDTKLFEFLTLESFQAGLSWHLILKKRDNFRKLLPTLYLRKLHSSMRMMWNAYSIMKGLCEIN